MIVNILLVVAVLIGFVLMAWVWLAMAFGAGESLVRSSRGMAPLTWREIITMSYLNK